MPTVMRQFEFRLWVESCPSPSLSEVALLSHNPCSPSAREAGHEATRFHNFSRRRDGGMAARCARAAEGDAGDRRPLRRVAQRVFWTVYGRVPPGTERSRLRRGTECGDRIPLGGGSLRLAARLWRPP